MERCLAKEPRSRYASTEDLARELATVRDHLSEATSGSGASLGVRPAPRRRLGWIVAGILSARSPQASVTLFAIRASRVEPLQYTPITFNRGWITSARFTPDGQSVVYSAHWEGKPLELYSTRLGNPESVSLGLPPAHLLSISRKGDMAILMDPVDRDTFYVGTLARAPLGGGAPRQISRSVSDADWGPDGQLAVLRWSEDETTQVLEYPAGKALYQVRRPKRGLGRCLDAIPQSLAGRTARRLHRASRRASYSGTVAIVDLRGPEEGDLRGMERGVESGLVASRG